MSPSRLLGALALVAAVALAPIGPARAADGALTVVGTDVTAYPDVRIVVASPPELGNQTLADGAFRVVENGRARPVQVTALSADQLEVALAIDTSGSMTGAPLAAAKAAASAFLAQLPTSVPVSVVGFGTSATVVSPRSTDRPAQLAAVAALGAGGQTALYNALGVAMAQLPPRGDRRVVVLLTDGGDTASSTTLDAAARALAAAKIPLFAVELRTAETNLTALTRLTSAAGGSVASASDPAALAGAFDAIARRLVREYALTYRSEARGDTDVDVALDAPGVHATTRAHLSLPAAPPSTVPSASGPAAAPGPAASSSAAAGDRWYLVGGSALCGVALLLALLALFGPRTPRARGFGTARPQRRRIVAAADLAEAVGTRVLPARSGIPALSGALEAGGVDIRVGELLVGMAGATVAAFVGGWLLLAPVVGLALAVAVPLGTRIGLDAMAQRRRKRFEQQMPETLQILAGSLRAGHGLARGIETVAREASPPTSEEFRRLTVETRLGRDFVEAMRAVADRMGGEDFRWVVQAVEIQREVGGDLAAVLDTVASTIRDRARIRQQVSALSAEGRMSAWVLMVLPFGMAAIMAVTNPAFLSPLLHTGTGLRLLGVAAALLVVGGLWLRRIVKPIF